MREKKKLRREKRFARKRKRILRVEDMLELFPVSGATFDRWLKETMEGINDLAPLPFTQPGKRRLWDACVVEQWISNRHQATAPTPSPAPAKSEKQKAKDFNERQERAKTVIARHASKK